jgi:tetratricopeptide (TPR) repeat protein
MPRGRSTFNAYGVSAPFGRSGRSKRVNCAVAGSNRAMADYYRFKDDANQMRTLIERARAADSKDPGLAYVLGSSVAGDKAAAERAIRYFDEALEGQPAMNRARYKLARVYQAQEDNEKAMLQIEAVLKAEPDHERAKALKLELEPPPTPKPAEPEPEPEPEKKTLTYEQLLNKAERLRQSDRAGQALGLYERASEMEPTDAEGYIGLGFCYIDLENSGAAISSFKQALRYAPRMSDAHIGLAEAYRMKGDKVNAIKHYKRYLDIMPTGPEAPVARRMIKMLGK